MIKILYIIPALTIGGAEKLVADILPMLKRAGYDVSLLTLKKNEGILYQSLVDKEISVYSLNLENIYSIKLISRLKSYLGEYEIVHVHLFPALYWVALSKLFYKIRKPKLIYTEHSTHNKRRNKKYFKFIEKFIYSRYDNIICITEQVRNNLCHWINIIPNNKFVIINNGIDLNLFKNASAYSREELSLPFFSKIIFMSARFTPAKDHTTIIQALKMLEDKNIYLLLAGDGNLRLIIEELVHDLGIQDQVKFLGTRYDIPQLIKSSDICILSSNWEGFGLSAIEYMAGGKPVIASDIDGVGDIVRNAGLLFEKNNAFDLRDKINILLNSQVEYSKISEQCEVKASFFSLEGSVNEHIKLYKELYK